MAPGQQGPRARVPPIVTDFTEPGSGGIYVSKEEPVEVNLSTRQRLKMGPPLPVTWVDSAAQWTPGHLVSATLRVAQLLASSVHWQEGWVEPLVPSRAAPQGLPMGRIRANCVMEARALQAQEIIGSNLPMTQAFSWKLPFCNSRPFHPGQWDLRPRCPGKWRKRYVKHRDHCYLQSFCGHYLAIFFNTFGWDVISEAHVQRVSVGGWDFPWRWEVLRCCDSCEEACPSTSG